jgi:hypothetical protein
MIVKQLASEERVRILEQCRRATNVLCKQKLDPALGLSTLSKSLTQKLLELSTAA